MPKILIKSSVLLKDTKGRSLPHPPRVERIIIIRRAGRMNAHRPFCGGGVAQSATGGGDLSPEALAKDETQVTKRPQGPLFILAAPIVLMKCVNC